VADNDYEVTILETLSWESQVCQYPPVGEPGISYFAGDVSDSFPDKPPIHCLLYRAPRGILVGILNFYEVDYPPHEQAGNINVFVKANQQRKGIGTALVLEALGRWPQILSHPQRYSAAGVALRRHLDKQFEEALDSSI